MKRHPGLPPATLIVNARSQITLPQGALEAIGATSGDLVRLTVAGEVLLIRRVGPSVVKQTAGSLHAYVTRRRRPAPLTNEQES